MTPTTARKIGLAAAIMMASVFLSRVLGVGRESVIAALGGASLAVDAYKTAFALPEILNHILASGFLSVTFIPIFARYLAAKNEGGGWYIFWTILSWGTAVMSLLMVICLVGAPHIVPLIAPGRDDPQFLFLTVRMTRIILPAQLFFFAGGLLMAVQFAKERFLLPALAPLVYNLSIILSGILLSKRLGIEAFSWGALAGAFIGSFVLQWFGARQAGLRGRPNFNFRHPDLRRYILLTLPLMLGLTMTFSTEIFIKLFGSFLPNGAIAWLDFAWRIVGLLVGFFGQAVGAASYPFLTKLAAENRMEEMNRIFNGTLRYLALVIPVAVLFMVLREEIVRMLFERRLFSPLDTRMTAIALAGMLIGAAAFTAQTVVNRGFYAVQNTLTPAIYTSLATLVSLPLYWVGLKTLKVLGLGLAVSLSAVIQVGVLYGVWNRRSANRGSGQVYRFYLKITLLSIPLGALLAAAHRLVSPLIDTASFFGSLAMCAAVTLMFVAIFIPLARWYDIPEVRLLWQKSWARIARKPPAR
jgi:putative peptidoglycan lipid II flippase